MQIYSVTGNILIDLSLVAFVGLIVYFTGLYRQVVAKPAILQKGVLIYKCFAGDTRNLSQYFAQLQPDMEDYYLDNNVQVKFPLAALFHHDIQTLSRRG